LRQRSDVPVVMFSAKDTEVDEAVSVELGADD
jgi:DNA-binding response OmpR family regulator